ncbi:periplasmic heavy metal sensor [Pseudomonas sp. C27(2019)]|uniref:periplasmic heavy metal sensor n=1 Tax=Pseudomonas sp. C27(2019) TaxID=2604941 RepID=UPI0012486527|nr:periplasmic heavy metal sensor [Pseudomonas sp. C27(2019)]QEY57863.1 periplasmic heavy metal sensor [Pseudomonas sp. C27(2019)]
MNQPKKRRYFIFLTLLNFGILLAIVWASWGGANKQLVLANYLQLDAQQVLHWRQAEQAFLVQLETNENAIKQQRNSLIEAVFADDLDLENVDLARQSLAQLQNQQQEIVVKQLLAEREILTARQRGLLKELLLQQPMHASHYEQLHKSE